MCYAEALLVQTVFFGFRIGELSCPARYFPEASSVSFVRSVRYGFGVLGTLATYVLARIGLAKFPILDRGGNALGPARAFRLRVVFGPHHDGLTTLR